MTDWEKVGVNLLRRRINAALAHHHMSHWASGPGCSTCRILVQDEYGTRREPAPWPCPTYQALTGEKP